MRLFPISVPFVKMCLERPAGRDKHEYKNFIFAKNAQSEAEAFQIVRLFDIGFFQQGAQNKWKTFLRRC